MNYLVGQELLDAERGHLVRLLVWSLASMLAGTVCLAWRRRAAAPSFWLHAGIQSVVWGAVDLGIVALAWSGLSPRDLAGAIALDRFLWLNVGLDVGYAMVGATLVILGMRAPCVSGSSVRVWQSSCRVLHSPCWISCSARASCIRPDSD